jgi:hypothetical protein
MSPAKSARRSVHDVLRPIQGNSAAPRVILAGPTPLAKGELLRFSVEMPDLDGHLTLFFMVEDDAYSLDQPRREAARARPSFGEPVGGFSGWEIDAPFGRDWLIAIVSSEPLFTAARPDQENAASLAEALAQRLDALRARGVRVGAHVLAVDTVERREQLPAPALAVVPRPPLDQGQRAARLKAASDAAQALPCSHLRVDADDVAIRIAGLVPKGADVALATEIVRRGVPRDALRLETRSFDGPYCGTVDLIRRLRSADAPGVELIGKPPLAKGELLRFSVGLSAFGGHLSVTYLTKSGDAIHLVPPRPARPGARIRFGDPTDRFTGWEIDEPFGTDMVLVLVSDDPGFLGVRPESERAEDFARHLSERIRTLQARGRRVGAQLMPVDTVERR